MIEIYIKKDKELIKLDTVEPYTWLNVSNPTDEELAFLASNMNIPEDFINDALDPDERPRIETEDGVVFIVMRAPVTNEQSPEPFSTVPIGIILTRQNIITITKDKDIVWDLLMHQIHATDFTRPNRNTLIIRIYQRSTILFLRYLKRINSSTKIIEEKLKNSMQNQDLFELLNLEKSLVYFITSLKSNEFTLRKIMHVNLLHLNEDEREEVEDIRIDIRQAVEMSTIYINILRDMMDTFASMFSNNLNVVMKTLTVITIAMMVPTLISSFYGMNVPLPFQNSQSAYLVLFVASIFFSIITLYYFKKRKLF